MKFPFDQEIIGAKLKRTFSGKIEEDDLKWHQDLKNRKVLILENNGWKFQFDNELPFYLKKGDKLEIQKHVWHRVIKGDGQLVVEIEEYGEIES